MNTTRQLLHCCSCGACGTVLDLVASHRAGCGVREAAQKLASWRNLRVADSGGPSVSGRLVGWWLTAADLWMERSRDISFPRVSPNRRCCSTCTAR